VIEIQLCDWRSHNEGLTW